MYTMKAVCEQVDMTYETLKYYCNQGLVPNLKRDGNNHRIFDERNIAWIQGLQYLRKAGMSLKDMHQYMEYCLAGKTSIPERRLMLEATKEQLLAKKAEIEASILYIEKKDQLYADMFTGKVKYTSTVLPDDAL